MLSRVAGAKGNGRKLALLSVVALGCLQTSLASAATTVTAPYFSESKHHSEASDLTGTGQVSATSTSSKLTGKITAYARASSDSPVGQIVDLGGWGAKGVGGTSAFSYGEMIHVFTGLPPGEHSVSVSIASINTSWVASSSPPLVNFNGYRTAYAMAITQADVVAEFYSCVPRSLGCSYDKVERQVVPLANSGSNLTITLDQPRGNATAIVVRTGLVSRAQAWGKSGSAEASVSGTVSSITIT